MTERAQRLLKAMWRAGRPILNQGSGRWKVAYDFGTEPNEDFWGTATVRLLADEGLLVIYSGRKASLTEEGRSMARILRCA